MQAILPIEASLEEHVAFLQTRLPGMTVEDSEDLLLVDSGLPTDTFSKILRLGFEPCCHFIEYQ